MNGFYFFKLFNAMDFDWHSNICNGFFFFKKTIMEIILHVNSTKHNPTICKLNKMCLYNLTCNSIVKSLLHMRCTYTSNCAAIIELRFAV